MKHTKRRNFLYILAVVAHVSVSPSTAAEAVEKPIIKLTSPSGGRVWVSGYAEVTRGYSFVFTCSFNSSDSPSHFILKFSGLDPSKNYQTNQSNSFSFSAAEYDHEGNYSCVYEGNRNHTSNESEPIYVIIKYPLLNLLIYSVVPGAALLLLVVVLVVVLVCRRRRRARQPEAVILNQTVKNNYDEEEEEEEEEEQNYVNVDPGDTNRKSNPAVEVNEDDNDHENPEDEDDDDYENLKDEDDNDYENPEDEDDNDHENPEDEDDDDYENLKDEDDNDYENPEDEDDNDHENPEDEDDDDYENLKDEDDNDYENLKDEDDNVKVTKASVTAKDQREEDCDEEESSSDEHDYVNFAESISEQTLNIYEGQQDIYQNN